MIDTSKIIIGTVGGGRYTVTAPIIKEDYGLYLKIEGLELPSTYEVDFSNSEHNGTSVTMIGNSDGVLIPSQFISSGKDVFAFLYHVGEDFGRTIYKFRIPNKLRPDRTNEIPTPEEQSVIDQAISALNEAVEQTAQDVIDADASAQSASQSAENAHDSAVDAQNYAESASGYASDAQGYATTASQKATAAGNSADRAAQIKTDIEGYVSTAQTAAQTATDKAAQASQSATNASNSATTATTKAGEASASATTASNKAGEASASATTASNKASEASGYANTASQKASDASDSASAALGYKTDAESAKTAAQTAQGLAEDAQEAAETAAASVSASAAQIATNTADIASLEADRYKAFPTDTASGSIASFPDGADDIPLKSLIVDIDPVQDLSNGDPSPENICPISGWTEVDVEQRGVNVWDEEWETIAGVRIGSKNYISVVPNATYYFGSATGGSFSNGIRFYDLNKTQVGVIWVGGAVTIPSNVYFCKFFMSTSYGTTYNHDISINYPSTDHSYHPYTGRSITINLGQTVYGGRLDVISGELTVYPYYASYNGETLTGRWVSDRDKYVAGTTPTIGAQVVNIGAQGVTVQLEPYEVESLHGVNNLWADSGDTEVEYRADTKLYIAKKIAEAISALS